MRKTKPTMPKPRLVTIPALALAAFTAFAVVAGWLAAGRMTPPALGQVLPSLTSQEPPPAPADLGTATAEAPAAVQAGGQGVLRVRVTIREGWHVNANPPSLDYLVPTSLSLETPRGLTAGRPRYPAGRVQRFAFAEEPLAVYDGTFVLEVPLAAAADAPPGAHELKGAVRYQACNDELCLAPVAKPFSATLVVEAGKGGAAGAGDTAATGTGALVGAPGAPAAGDGRLATGPSSGGAAAGREAAAGGGAVARSAADNPVARLFDERGLLAFFFVFLLGLGLNLTPCVYPMMSVTLALFGAREERSLLKRVPVALVYMLGIALTYSALGLVAAFTGTLFGSVLQSPAVLVGIAAVLAAMALSMFGLFEIQLPSSWLTRLSSGGATGLAGVFFSGVMVGLFAAPCVGPPIVALLAVVAQSGNPWFGFLSFFVLSIGLGLPYLVLGTFSGLLQRLPRSGAWMVWVKKVFGVLLLAVALFYLSLAVKPQWSPWVVPVALAAGGLHLGFLARQAGASRAFTWLRRGAGATAILAGAWLALTAPAQGVAWEPFAEERLAQTLAEGRPVILDFYADWCVPCHELDRLTFTDPAVRRLAARFATFKVDLTRFESPEAARLRERFAVEGVPTVVFLAPDGGEVPETRVVGFIGPREFAARARRALAGGGPSAR